MNLLQHPHKQFTSILVKRGVLTKLLSLVFTRYKKIATNREVSLGISIDKDDIPRYKCPHCGYVNSENEITKYWDWSGPVCINCRDGGMSLFSVYGVPESGKGVFVRMLERIIDAEKNDNR